MSTENINKLYLYKDEQIIWQDYRKIFGITFPFTKFTLTNKKIYIERGILRYNLNEIQLIRVQDVLLQQGFIEKLLGIGSIVVKSSDRSGEVVRLGSISKPYRRKHQVTEAAEKEKVRRGVTSNQFI